MPGKKVEAGKKAGTGRRKVLTRKKKVLKGRKVLTRRETTPSRRGEPLTGRGEASIGSQPTRDPGRLEGKRASRCGWGSARSRA